MPRREADKRRGSTRTSADARLAKLGRSILDGTAIDWDAESARTKEPRPGLRGLRNLEALIRASRAVAAAQPTEAPPILFEWGPFQALELVGEGGFGQVFRAFDTRLRREVALKLRREGAGSRGEGARRFLEEARHLARVRHSNVLVVHGADVHGRRAGFWTDFIRGRTLADLLRERGTLPGEECARIGVDLCRALRAVHAAGLVHGDLKPANVMCESGGRILLMDFGAVTRLAPDGTSDLPGQAFGTPAYLAPEVLRGEATGPRADLYSLGVLLHVMATATLPVTATSVTELLRAHELRAERSEPLKGRDLSPALVDSIERALSPAAERRYESADEMERALLVALPASADVEGQSLRDLLAELARVPEKLALSIGAQIVRALLREPGETVGEGRLDLERLFLLPDGRVRLRDGIRPGLPDAPREIGRVIEELATGQASSEGAPGQFAPGLSPFTLELIRELRAAEAEPAMSDLSALWVILTEGEASAWWRSRRRELRKSVGPSRPGPVIARDTALYGRDSLSDRLRERFAQVQSGRGAVLLLTGEAGIGKTRLIGEFLDQLERDGVECHHLFGSYAPSSAINEAGAILDAFRGFLGEADLESALADYLVEAPLLRVPLHAFLAGRAEEGEASRSGFDLVQRALVQLTQAIAAERPTIIWIDDLHFASGDGLDLFAALAQAVAGRPILLLGTLRPTLPKEWSANLLRLEHAEELPIPRLSEPDVRRLLTEALASRPLAEELAPGLMQRSDGNPLFLFEYLRALDVDGDSAAEGTEQMRHRLRGLSAPGSVQRLIQARCAAIAEEDQEALDVASCLGYEFDADLVAEALGQPVLPVLRRLAAIERRHGLVRSAGRRFVFDHHEVQQALYDGLFEPLREQYHLALAQVVEQREERRMATSPEPAGGVAAFIAEHFLRGGDGERAQRYLRPAIEHLEQTYANDAAVRLADLALERAGLLLGLDRIEVLALKARCLAIQGRVAEEEVTLREQFDLAEKSGDRKVRASAHARLGDLALRRSDHDGAHQLLTEGVRLGAEVGDLTVQFYCQITLGNLFFRQGKLQEAREACQLGLHLAQQSGDSRNEANAAGYLGMVLGSLGKRDDARVYFERSRSLARGRLRHGRSAGRLQPRCSDRVRRRLSRSDGVSPAILRSFTEAGVSERAGDRAGKLGLGAPGFGTHGRGSGATRPGASPPPRGKALARRNPPARGTRGDLRPAGFLGRGARGVSAGARGCDPAREHHRRGRRSDRAGSGRAAGRSTGGGRRSPSRGAGDVRARGT
ncbi:MAG: protein kinase [Candidatus Eisenbacteria bacterium]|nr:protein kinase [Candidatus Eisenbacteria bacterium]